MGVPPFDARPGDAQCALAHRHHHHPAHDGRLRPVVDEPVFGLRRFGKQLRAGAGAQDQRWQLAGDGAVGHGFDGDRRALAHPQRLRDFEIAQAQAAQWQPRLRRGGGDRFDLQGDRTAAHAQLFASVAEGAVEHVHAAPQETRGRHRHLTAALGDQQETPFEHVVMVVADRPHQLLILADLLQRRAFGRVVVETPVDQDSGFVDQAHRVAQRLLHVRR